MGSTDVALLGVLIFLGLGLSWFAIRVNMILWRLGAALSWFSIGVLIWTNELGTDLTDPWTYAVGLALFVMIIAVLQLQMKTDVAHERSVRGKIGGYPGAESESWTTWGPKKSGKGGKPGARERQTAYREKIRGSSKK